MSERPFITMNMAMTADGKITSAARELPSFTSAEDQKGMDRLRAEADAVLIGAGTMRADDPPLQPRHPHMQAYRRELGKLQPVMAVLVSGSLQIDPAAGFFTQNSGRRIIATVQQAPQAQRATLEQQAELWTVGEQQVDLVALVERLYREGVRTLLVEGGAEINWGFLVADLFDELNITVAPALLGGRTAPTIIGGEGLPMAQQRRLQLLEARVVDNEVFCRYRMVRNAEG